ncbi:MAG TPA: F0F1 ATP synthase subunit B [Candidatus Krumholzibacteria bacterium]|nr:F0F1 ATP synthase subunit B [Candidatus Krumholzibacteria bacterium]
MNLDWKALLTQALGFLIVVWLLRKYAWGKLLAFTEKRRETIAAEFASIEKSKGDVDGLRRKFEEELAGIETTRRARIQEAVSDAHQIAGEIRDEARKEAIAMRVKAGEDINLDMDKANVAFRDDMVNAVIGATEKLIRTRLDDAQHRTLINQFLDEVGSRPARG